MSSQIEVAMNRDGKYNYLDSHCRVIVKIGTNKANCSNETEVSTEMENTIHIIFHSISFVLRNRTCY